MNNKIIIPNDLYTLYKRINLVYPDGGLIDTEALINEFKIQRKNTFYKRLNQLKTYGILSKKRTNNGIKYYYYPQLEVERKPQIVVSKPLGQKTPRQRSTEVKTILPKRELKRVTIEDGVIKNFKLPRY